MLSEMGGCPNYCIAAADMNLQWSAAYGCPQQDSVAVSVTWPKLWRDDGACGTCAAVQQWTCATRSWCQWHVFCRLSKMCKICRTTKSTTWEAWSLHVCHSAMGLLCRTSSGPNPGYMQLQHNRFWIAWPEDILPVTFHLQLGIRTCNGLQVTENCC